MKQLTLACWALFGLSGCVAMHYDVWTPMDNAARESREMDSVEHLEAPPDKPYTVIGVITPLLGEYGSDDAAVKAMRIEAAKYGADAVFFETHPQAGGWQFSANPFDASNECSSGVIFQARAIVWQEPPASN